jgi:hypothetical protein
MKGAGSVWRSINEAATYMRSFKNKKIQLTQDFTRRTSIIRDNARADTGLKICKPAYDIRILFPAAGQAKVHVAHEELAPEKTMPGDRRK